MNFQNFITRDLLKNLKKWCRQFGIFHYLYLPLVELSKNETFKKNFILPDSFAFHTA